MDEAKTRTIDRDKLSVSVDLTRARREAVVFNVTCLCGWLSLLFTRVVGKVLVIVIYLMCSIQS